MTEVCINNEKICFQNLFTLGLLALGLCFLREPMELGIYNKNCYNFQKLTKRLGQVREKYPKTHKICKTLLSEEDSYKLSYGNILR